ncbi:GerAB/ArcD/ProY family transporter [Paenibacillus campinasensis]|uniref:Spore gernimation protein n=1 Tax=Paenibacillus campinasensis TaxID=66347 RepID=A0A268EW84_9BACL|nr:GerAB/ArcD/ProY family transporter [Paenibacillus campinasensis]PAD77379.1 spore gernimation protein [Paenibacillus campinasensis]
MVSTTNKHTDQITTAQAAVLVINYTLGASIMTISRNLLEAARTPDIWISVILSGLICFLAGLFILWLCQRFRGKTLYEFMPEITGKSVAYVIIIIMIVYFITMSAYELRMMTEVTSDFLLEDTPRWSIIMAFMWIALYLNVGGINSMARLNEIVLPITLIFFMVCILSSLNLFDIKQLRPVLGAGITPVLHGIMPALSALTGYEILFILIAFMKTPKQGIRALHAGVWIPTMIILITVILSIGVLGLYATANKTYPTLTLVRSYEYQGLIFERFESLMLVIWIMQMFTSFSIMHYAASLGCSTMFNKKPNSLLFVTLPLIFIVSMVPKTLMETVKLGEMLGVASIILFGGFPPILLLVSVIRKKGMRRK